MWRCQSSSRTRSAPCSWNTLSRDSTHSRFSISFAIPGWGLFVSVISDPHAGGHCPLLMIGDFAGHRTWLGPAGWGPAPVARGASRCHNALHARTVPEPPARRSLSPPGPGPLPAHGARPRGPEARPPGPGEGPRSPLPPPAASPRGGPRRPLPGQGPEARGRSARGGGDRRVRSRAEGHLLAAGELGALPRGRGPRNPRGAAGSHPLGPRGPQHRLQIGRDDGDPHQRGARPGTPQARRAGPLASPGRGHGLSGRRAPPALGPGGGDSRHGNPSGRGRPIFCPHPRGAPARGLRRRRPHGPRGGRPERAPTSPS